MRVFDAVIGPDDNGNDISINHPAIHDLINRIKILLKAAKAEERESDNHHEALKLHDLVSNLTVLGDISPFLDIAIRLYPEQATTSDKDGNYPLHLVAGNPYIGPASSPLGHLHSWTPRDPIEVLVSSFPSAAAYTDRNGDLPLHLALKSGQRKWGSGLASLVMAFSDALHCRDRETGLYPFQLAAAFPTLDDLECLGTIFELLVACPHVVQLGKQ